MCQISAVGTSIPSLTWKAGLAIYVDAVAEKSRNPPRTTIQNPIQFHANNASERCAGVWRFFPSPSRRKSTAMFVPSQMDKPEKWISWINGYTQSDVRTPVPHQVPSSHLQKATSDSCIRLDLPSACSQCSGPAGQLTGGAKIHVSRLVPRIRPGPCK